MIDRNHGWIVSFKPVYLGYILSILLTAALYRAVVGEHLSGFTLFITIFSLTIIQVIFQLVLFLQVGMENKPRFPTISLLFAIGVILIVVGGSIWIMTHLNYNLMPKMPHMMPNHGSF
ncbi:MAG: hypothetical protein EBU93_03755 [Chlamydiae bacterium]|nr:hypothetical protein [Chlamydiota bacterium]